MKIKSLIILFVCFSAYLSSQERLSMEENEIKLYKKDWVDYEVNKPIDTSKKIVAFNDYFNINQWIFSTKKEGESIKYRLNYTSDTIEVKILSKTKAILHIVVFDTLKNILEEGDLKGIGPICIRQRITSNVTSNNFEYTLYYYLIKNGNWIYYDAKQKKTKQVKSEIPKRFNIDHYTKEYINLVSERRKKYIKEKKLPADFYE
jgi:hypothetical protein